MMLYDGRVGTADTALRITSGKRVMGVSSYTTTLRTSHSSPSSRSSTNAAQRIAAPVAATRSVSMVLVGYVCDLAHVDVTGLVALVAARLQRRVISTDSYAQLPLSCCVIEKGRVHVDSVAA